MGRALNSLLKGENCKRAKKKKKKTIQNKRQKKHIKQHLMMFATYNHLFCSKILGCVFCLKNRKRKSFFASPQFPLKSIHSTESQFKNNYQDVTTTTTPTNKQTNKQTNTSIK